MTATTTPADQAVCASPDAAFEHACERGWAPVVRYLRAVLRAVDDVDDAAAATFEIAWRRRDELPASDEIVPWLLGVAANVARNQQRSARRLQRLRAQLANLDPRGSSPAAHAALIDDEAGDATRALARLSIADREVLVLHAWEDLDTPTIARVLGIRPNTAAQRLHRARLRLADELERDAAEQETT